MASLSVRARADNEVLALPEEDQRWLSDALLDRIEPIDDDVRAVWNEAAVERLEALERGEAPMTPGKMPMMALYLAPVGRDEIERVIAKHLDDRAPAVVAAWLYGSVARGDDRATSDVDVAILLARSERPTKLAHLPLDLEAELASLLGREVQLVVVDHAPDDLIHRILVDGHLLLDRNPSARIAFEVASRNKFFDMQPIWNTYRKRAS